MRENNPVSALFKKPIDPTYAMIIIAILNGFFFAIVEAWTVGGGEGAITGLIAQSLVGPTLAEKLPFWSGRTVYVSPFYWKIFISLGMCFGAFVGAVFSNEFFIRIPRKMSEWVLISIGGLLMGVGIRFALVCNVSTFFGATPQLSLAGYFAIIGILPGAWVGSMIYQKIMEMD
jgi:hypothetical protein